MACLLLIWLAAVATGFFTSPDMQSSWPRLGNVLIAGLWASPFVTWPILYGWSSYGSSTNTRPWWRENRWGFFGMCAGVLVAAGLGGTALLGVVSLFHSFTDTWSAELAVLVVMLWSWLTGLPLWTLVLGLIVGPGPRPRTAAPVAAR